AIPPPRAPPARRARPAPRRPTTTVSAPGPDAARSGRGSRRGRDGRMPLRAHIRELRNRLLLAVIGVAVGAVVGWILYLPLFEVLQEPVVELAAARGDLIS